MATREEDRELLEGRARVLARPAVPPAGDTLELISFALAGETYAIESRFVFALFRLDELARLPGAEPPVFGVTRWRGELLSVLDLRPVLGLPGAALDDLSRVLVLGKAEPAFGILADRVHGLLAVPAGMVREPPEGPEPRRDYLQGVTGEAVIVLAAERLLARNG